MTNKQLKALETRVQTLETNVEVLRILAGRFAQLNGIRIETLKSGIIVISEKVKK